MARKYLNAGLGAAQYPHFVALYADYYGHIDSDGAGELTEAELKLIRDETWRESLCRGHEGCQQADALSARAKETAEEPAGTC